MFILLRHDAAEQNREPYDDLFRYFRTDLEPTFENLRKYVVRGSSFREAQLLHNATKRYQLVASSHGASK